MDLNDIWQEHKVWILGVLAGVVVFLVANSMISSTWNTSTFEKRISSYKAQTKKKFFTANDRRAAAKDKKVLDGALTGVGGKTYFTARKEFDLAGKGGPTLHYLAMTTKVKNDVQAAMDSANVDFTQQQLGLPANSPVDRQEIQKTLIALDMIDDVIRRLLAAHDKVRAENIEAQGLRALDLVQIEIKDKDARRRRFSRKRGAKNVDLGARVSVRIRFHTDWITLTSFLESLVGAGERQMLLAEIAAKNSEKPGEPMAVTCRFLALLAKENV